MVQLIFQFKNIPLVLTKNITILKLPLLMQKKLPRLFKIKTEHDTHSFLKEKF